jgi:hypothetical protein
MSGTNDDQQGPGSMPDQVGGPIQALDHTSFNLKGNFKPLENNLLSSNPEGDSN